MKVIQPLGSSGGLRRKAFGEFLKEKRKKAKLTQTALAKLIGTDQRTISNLESGSFRFLPMPDVINELAFQLGIPARWLLQVAGYRTNGTEHEDNQMGDGSCQEEQEM